MRLNKFIAESGAASRRAADELIEQARITVNGKLVIELGYQVDEEKDDVRLDGEKLKVESKLYFLLNKPKGTVTTTKDEKGRKTVLDIIKSKSKVFPVGRLDYNTTGVLLITNDGDFTNKMTHPRNKIPRQYIAKLDKDLTANDKTKLSRGIILDGKRSKFTSVSFTDDNNYKRVLVTCVEGRNHFVKRMFSTLGYFVKDLARVSYGDFTVEDLNVGEYRKITPSELKIFYNKYKN
jgi:23S rRNA pseudouridine2605 synthase